MATGIGIKMDNILSVDNRSLGVIKRDAVLIAEAIHRILNTKPYERPREPIGCRIKEVLFEPNDFISATAGSYLINSALGEFETRAEVLQIIFNSAENKLIYEVVFRLLDDPNQLYSTLV